MIVLLYDLCCGLLCQHILSTSSIKACHLGAAQSTISTRRCLRHSQFDILTLPSYLLSIAKA